MSFLDKIFGRKPPDELPPPHAGEGYGQFNTPRGKYPIVSASGKGNGIDGWAPRVGFDLPPVANQDALLVHYDRENPSAPGHPSAFWQQRNEARLALGSRERLQSGGTVPGTDSWIIEQGSYKPVDDPKRTAVPNSRPTQEMSPSDYRFFAPMRAGRGDVPHLNGFHFSMASMRRAYPIRGMRPANHARNTFRLEPPPRDANNVDLPSEMPTVPAREYVSPQSTGAPSRSGSYRL